jgi:hypothetical protein
MNQEIEIKHLEASLQQERDIFKTWSYFKRIRHCAAHRLQVICRALSQECDTVLRISWKSLETWLDCFTWDELVNMCEYFPKKNNESLDKKTFSELNSVLHNLQKSQSASEIAAWSRSLLQFCVITASNQKLSGRTWSKQT